MGTFLPIPGVSPLEIEFFLERNSIARTFVNAFSGNNTFVIGIFALNIFPYINASILIQCRGPCAKQNRPSTPQPQWEQNT